MNVLVTGATGFVGRALIPYLDLRQGIAARGAVRTEDQCSENSAHRIRVGEIHGETRWADALAGIEVVVHTAARAHVMRDDSDDPLAAYRRVNVDGTLNLAQQAIEAGVRRFVYLSSIKVNGEATRAGSAYRSSDEPAPVDPYAISKLEAERGLRKLCGNGSMEWVVIRPPLVYGPGVKANFLSMMRWLRLGLPLPLSLIRNKRSLVALDNLIDLIATCIESPAAANRLFLVSDDHDLSTAELLRILGNALGRPARLLPFPIWLLRVLANMVGKRGVAQRLFDSLQVDISDTKSVLGWAPPLDVEQAMQKTADYFLRQSSGQ